VASLNLEYSGEDRGGVYHSAYDDLYWYTHFDDSAFVYERALAQTVGIAVMRLADADVLPFDFTSVAEVTARYTRELRDLWQTERDEAEERAAELGEGLFAAIADPRAPGLPPPLESLPPPLDLTPLDSAVEVLGLSAERYEQALVVATSAGEALGGPGAATVNALLRRLEPALTDPEGLPGRPWYRHVLYAPGRYTGYAVKTLPGVREAIEAGRWTEAETEAGRASAALRRAATLLDSAAHALRELARP